MRNSMRIIQEGGDKRTGTSDRSGRIHNRPLGWGIPSCHIVARVGLGSGDDIMAFTTAMPESWEEWVED